MTVFAVTRAMDFMTVRAPLMTAAMWVRGVPDRLLATIASEATRSPAQLPVTA